MTYLPVIARAAIETLREFPSLNATLEGETITTYEGVHLGVAVSLGEGGLIVPVIRDAQELSVEGLAGRIKELAGAGARERADRRRGPRRLVHDHEPGRLRLDHRHAVINQPQVAILDTEAVVKRPVVVTDELGGDSIAIRHMTYLCMSWDHRALDGALAARFLRALADRLEAWPVKRSRGGHSTAARARRPRRGRGRRSAEQVDREVDPARRRSGGQESPSSTTRASTTSTAARRRSSSALGFVVARRPSRIPRREQQCARAHGRDVDPAACRAAIAAGIPPRRA